MSKTNKSWSDIIKKNNETEHFKTTINKTAPLIKINQQIQPAQPAQQIQQIQQIQPIQPTQSIQPIHFDINESNFRDMADHFHTNGFIILDNAIPQDKLDKIRDDLNKIDNQKKSKKSLNGNRHIVHKCFFENSKATVDLISNSKLYDFASYIIGDVPGNRGNTLTAHLIHNNAFIVPSKGRGQAPSWHTDDALQQIILNPGTTLPSYVKLPVLVVTYMIWLSDCNTPDNGPTYVVPGSHRFGSVVDNELADQLGIPACGKAGTAVLINSQVWHRGCENKSDIPRETLQLTFGRRIIGHKFKSIMNYQMPEHITKNMNEKTKERFGFLEGGAYS